MKQHLLLGMNAHINEDLRFLTFIFTLCDFAPLWLNCNIRRLIKCRIQILLLAAVLASWLKVRRFSGSSDQSQGEILKVRWRFDKRDQFRRNESAMLSMSHL
ncbi:MAG: hypothetical protein ACYSR9_09225, partial [Planctomycetota bacterium]